MAREPTNPVGPKPPPPPAPPAVRWSSRVPRPDRGRDFQWLPPHELVGTVILDQVTGKPDWYRLDRDVRGRYVDGAHVVMITVHAGLLSDLSSVPWYLRSIAPHWRLSARPGELHDGLYQSGMLPKLFADELYRQALIDEGVSRTRARAMRAAVLLFGWKAWRRHRAADATTDRSGLVTIERWSHKWAVNASA